MLFRWLLVGALGVAAAGVEPALAQSPRELGKSELGESELGKSELGKSELGKSELGKSELGKSELGRDELGNTVQFSRSILPLLTDKCFPCHGPDPATRQADLRLDAPQSAFQDRGGLQAIVPGDLGRSELYRRITAEDDSERMPPADFERQLSAAERDLIKSWIEQGAKYESHWSFLTPRTPPMPRVQRRDWPLNEIDYFVLATLERNGLAPSSRADWRRLIRRVTLDLTGLPPTPQEVEVFLADPSPNAYEKLVDRLLAAPRYGERMASEWLDAARYADTHGYLFDTQRSMWRWRDWVIEAFNSNQPFDEFTIEQLAGDLLPDPGPAQRIATGFNRNHIINNEAGAIPEEYFVENIVDRINTTSTVWMGLTAACAQCHDHKYDPLTQREYYQLYAFFNNVPEIGLDGFNANAKPLITAPTPEQIRRLAELDAQLGEAEEAFAPLTDQVAEAQAKWEGEFYTPLESLDGLASYLPFDGAPDDGCQAARSPEIKDGMPSYEAGILGEAFALDGQRYVEVGDVGNFDRGDAFTLSAWVFPSQKKGRRSIFSRMEPPEVSFRGYALQLFEGFPSLFLIHSFPDNMLQLQGKLALEPHQWQHVAAVYDGSGKVAGAKLYVDGKLQETTVAVDQLTESFQTRSRLQIGNGYPVAKFVGRIDEARVYHRALTENEIGALPGLSIHSLLASERKQRTEEQTKRIRDYYLKHAAPQQWRESYETLVRLRDEKSVAERDQPTVMVMEELEPPRETRMLVRGAYSRPGEVVTASTPAFLPSLPTGLPRNRLGLARWLTNPRHPLTARVTVNRFWQVYFGTGLVATAENFGLQGEFPSHPELLDWLAIEFVRSGWDVKALQRLIVTSAAYQQTSAASEQLLAFDPRNRLLARGPRHRLPAESIRDQALAISGLLVERQGGPSVKPYQPPGLWKEVAFDVTGQALTAQIYEQDHGASLYRRTMYTFWKRTAPPPTMLIFDGPDRERCVVQRERTSTPLQALVLMNDPTYVEASRKLAERMITEGGCSPAERIDRGFLLATSRIPAPRELAPLLALLEEQLARFAADAAAAKGILGVGESPRDAGLSAAELAAYTVIANILLNLDETITKG